MKKLFTPSDLYWSSLWLLTRVFYSAIPIPVFFAYWKFKGTIRSFGSPDRRTMRRNLAALLNRNNGDLNSIIRRHFVFLEEYAPIHKLPSLRSFDRSTQWEVEGLLHLDQALSSGKGVILLTAHFGYAPLLKQILATRGYQVRRVRARGSKRAKQAASEIDQTQTYSRFKTFMHERFRVEDAAIDEDDLIADFNVRPIVESLSRNEVILILGDALHSVNFVELEVLGQLYPFPTGFMSIAMSSGACVLPTFAVNRSAGSGVKLVIDPPLAISSDGAPKEDLIRENIERFVRRFESYIEQYPHLFKIWAKDNWFQSRRDRSKKKLSKRY